MNLTDIIYEPYTIAIISAIIFTFIVYLFLKENLNKNDEKSNKNEMYKKLLISFISSVLVFLGIIYGLRTLSNAKVSEGMKGGGSISVSDLSEKLNIADNDVDFGLFEA